MDVDRYLSAAFSSKQYLIDVDPRVFVILRLDMAVISWLHKNRIHKASPINYGNGPIPHISVLKSHNKKTINAYITVILQKIEIMVAFNKKTITWISFWNIGIGESNLF